MVNPFLKQFQQFNNEVEEEKIIEFMSEIEKNIAYIKGTVSDAD